MVCGAGFSVIFRAFGKFEIYSFRQLETLAMSKKPGKTNECPFRRISLMTVGIFG